MDLLQNSKSTRRNPRNGFQLLNDDDSEQIATPYSKRVENRNNNNKRMNKNTNLESAPIFFPKSKSKSERKIILSFYDVYGNFQKEADQIMKQFQYFSRNQNVQFIKAEKEDVANVHILLGKEFLRDSTYAFSILPQDQISISKNGQFMNVCMIRIQTSPRDKVCGNSSNKPLFDEFPTYTLDFNTNHSIKYCPENSAIFQSLIEWIINQNGNQNQNQNRSISGSILKLKSGNLNEEISVFVDGFDTHSLTLKFVNEIYYKLFQKHPKETLYIQKERIKSLFQKMESESWMIKPILYEKLRTFMDDLVIEDHLLLNAYVRKSGNKNQITISQKAMEEYGHGFRDFYETKKGEFKSTHLKKYIMALYYMEHLNHRNENQAWMIPSTTYKRSYLNSNSNKSTRMMELQNSFYLGFDVEYIIIHHIQKYGKQKSLLFPLLIRNEDGSLCGIYYLYMTNSHIDLYVMCHREEDPKVDAKIDMYMRVIFEKSFLSKAPLQITYRGLVRKDPKVEFKLNFLDKNSMTLLYSHLHLFYQILNPNMDLNTILGKNPTLEMIMFITFLLEV